MSLLAAAPGYYTWDSLQTLAIATGAVIVVSNTVRMLVNVDSPWIPFLVAVALTVGGGVAGGHVGSVSDGLLAFLNACLLFCTAAGANKTLLKIRAPRKPALSARPVTWLSDWL